MGHTRRMGHTVTLFRPTGEKELALIRDSGWAAFPPRLPDQPTFLSRVEREVRHANRPRLERQGQ
jgi:hypothetical protein